MEEVEPIGPSGSITGVQGGDAVQGAPDVAIVLGAKFLGGVGEVGQEGEPKVGVGVGQVGNFEPFQQVRRAVGADEHARDDDHARRFGSGIPVLKSSRASFRGGRKSVE